MKKKTSVKKKQILKSKDYLKFVVPSIIGIVLVAIIVLGRFRGNGLLGSAYSITELESKIDSVHVGDTVNYNVNGYSDWQIVSIDKGNGTVDVISKDNVSDITLDEETAGNALNVFQEAANQYLDNNYVVSSRCVMASDLTGIEYDHDDGFWLNNANENMVSTTYGDWPISFDNPTFYIIPKIEVYDSNASNYDWEEHYNISIHGVDDWLIYSKYSNSLGLIPADPLSFQFEINTSENISDTINNFLNSFYDDDRVSYADAFYAYERDDVYYFYNQSVDYFRDNSEDIYWVARNSYSENINDEGSLVYLISNLLFYNGSDDLDHIVMDTWNYSEFSPLTLGFRPVLTLKFSDKAVGKDLDSPLKVGDNVKFESNGYKNWRILSIDTDNNTVDIISGYIVKNIGLSGRGDYDAMETIIQREVDAYKTGDVISARSVSSSDYDALIAINDRVSAEYWINEKRIYNGNLSSNMNTSSSTSAGYLAYQADVMSFEEDVFSITRKRIPLYFKYEDGGYSFGGGEGDQTYYAGIRPVLRLQLDKVTKEESPVEKSSYETGLDKEQVKRNASYPTRFIMSDSSSSKFKDGSTSSKSDGKVTNNYEENYTYNYTINKWVLRYIVLCVSLLVLMGAALIVLSSYVIRKINKIGEKTKKKK